MQCLAISSPGYTGTGTKTPSVFVVVYITEFLISIGGTRKAFGSLYGGGGGGGTRKDFVCMQILCYNRLKQTQARCVCQL